MSDNPNFFKQPNIRPALLLAGRLATASRMVIESDAKNLSANLLKLEEVLNEYNNEIMSLMNKEDGFFISAEEMGRLLSHAVIFGNSLPKNSQAILNSDEFILDYFHNYLSDSSTNKN